MVLLVDCKNEADPIKNEPFTVNISQIITLVSLTIAIRDLI